ncbi:MAG: hypothetical protein C4523_19615 [Myxococcales bacterium]|nr:MAG: hypothetical protein C4523_19615 [Myxococcales bacterium]
MPVLATPLGRAMLGERAGRTTIDPATLTLLFDYNAADLALSEGNAVASWPDSSGNAFDLAQATGTKQPTYRADAINGVPGVEFDGGDVLTGTVNYGGVQGATLFAVVKSGDSQDMVAEFNTVGNPGWFFYHNAGAFDLKVTVTGGASERTATTDDTTHFWIVEFVWDGTLAGNELIVASNGNAAGSFVINDNTSNTLGSATLHVGGRGTVPDLPMTGVLVRLLGAAEAWTPARREGVRYWLADWVDLAVL